VAEASDFSIFYALKKNAVEDIQGESRLGHGRRVFVESAVVHE